MMAMGHGTFACPIRYGAVLSSRKKISTSGERNTLTLRASTNSSFVHLLFRCVLSRKNHHRKGELTGSIMFDLSFRIASNILLGRVTRSIKIIDTTANWYDYLIYQWLSTKRRICTKFEIFARKVILHSHYIIVILFFAVVVGRS